MSRPGDTSDDHQRTPTGNQEPDIDPVAELDGPPIVEITEAINATKTATGAVAGGGAVLLAGFIVLLQAAVYALNLVMDAWLAAFIVGAVVSVVGYAMMQAGKKKFEPSALRPERTLHSLQKDKAAIKEATR